MSPPLVSVIIPTYNRAHLLRDAIESVRAQDYAAIELIVIDDGSTDATSQLVRSLDDGQLSYHHQANQGAPAARNAGIRASAGSYIAFLDSDDTWPREKLTTQIEYHLSHPEVDYSVTLIRNVLPPDCPRPAWVRPELLDRDFVGMLPGSLVARRCAFDRIGYFDERIRIGDDADWFFRARDANVPMAIIPQTLLYRRIHADNLCAQSEAATSSLLSVVRSSLNRRRAAEPGGSGR